MKTLAFFFAMMFSLLHAQEVVKLDSLVVNGREYKGAQITRFDQSVCRVVHSTGAARIPMVHLSEELQKRLGYDRAKEREEEIAKRNSQAEEESTSFPVKVESIALKNVNGKFRWFFRVTNQRAVPFPGAIKISLISRDGNRIVSSDQFSAAAAPIEPGLAKVVFLDTHTGPDSVHADAAIYAFECKIVENGVAQEDSIVGRTVQNIVE